MRGTITATTTTTTNLYINTILFKANRFAYRVVYLAKSLKICTVIITIICGFIQINKLKNHHVLVLFCVFQLCHRIARNH